MIPILEEIKYLVTVTIKASDILNNDKVFRTMSVPSIWIHVLSGDRMVRVLVSSGEDLESLVDLNFEVSNDESTMDYNDLTQLFETDDPHRVRDLVKTVFPKAF